MDRGECEGAAHCALEVTEGWAIGPSFDNPGVRGNMSVSSNYLETDDLKSPGGLLAKRDVNRDTACRAEFGIIANSDLRDWLLVFCSMYSIVVRGTPSRIRTFGKRNNAIDNLSIGWNDHSDAESPFVNSYRTL
jgi:hypothetical protein